MKRKIENNYLRLIQNIIREARKYKDKLSMPDFSPQLKADIRSLAAYLKTSEREAYIFSWVFDFSIKLNVCDQRMLDQLFKIDPYDFAEEVETILWSLEESGKIQVCSGMYALGRRTEYVVKVDLYESIVHDSIISKQNEKKS